MYIGIRMYIYIHTFIYRGNQLKLDSRVYIYIYVYTYVYIYIYIIHMLIHIESICLYM